MFIYKYNDTEMIPYLYIYITRVFSYSIYTLRIIVYYETLLFKILFILII